MIKLIALKDGRTVIATHAGEGTDLYSYAFQCMFVLGANGPEIKWNDFVQLGGINHDDMLAAGIVIDEREIRFTDTPIPMALESYEKLVDGMKEAVSGIKVVKTMPTNLKR